MGIFPAFKESTIMRKNFSNGKKLMRENIHAENVINIEGNCRKEKLSDKESLTNKRERREAKRKTKKRMVIRIK